MIGWMIGEAVAGRAEMGHSFGGRIGGSIAAIAGLTMTVRHSRKALSVKPERPTSLDLAEEFYLQRHLRQAVAQYRQALVLDPNCAEALSNLAFLLATASDDKSAAWTGSRQACRTRRTTAAGAAEVCRRHTGDGLCRSGTYR